MIYARLVYHDTADRGGQHTNKVLSCVLCRRVISGQDGGGDALCAGCVRVLVGREPRWAHEICRDAVREAAIDAVQRLRALLDQAIEKGELPPELLPENQHGSVVDQARLEKLREVAVSGDFESLRALSEASSLGALNRGDLDESVKDEALDAAGRHRVALEQIASVACEATLYPEYRRPEPEHCPHCRARAALDGLAT